ncbi:MAG: hypothetical protein QXG02_01635 [Candidatus Anstonellales archaeon]
MRFMRNLTKEQKVMLERKIEEVLPIIEDITGLKFKAKPEIEVSWKKPFITTVKAFFYLWPAAEGLSPWLNLRTLREGGIAIQYPESNSMWIDPKSGEYLESFLIHELVHVLDYQNSTHPVLKIAATTRRELVPLKYNYQFNLLKALTEGRATFLQHFYVQRDLESVYFNAVRRVEGFKEKKKLLPLDILTHFGSWICLGTISGIVSLIPLYYFWTSENIVGVLFSSLLPAAYLFATAKRYNPYMLQLFAKPIHRLIALDPYSPGLYFMASVAKEIGVKEAFQITLQNPPSSLEELMEPQRYVERITRPS